MKHSTLVAFLEGELSSERFSAEIAPEVDECQASIKASGSGRVIVVKDAPETRLTRAHARRLLQAMADATLSFKAAGYVADCMIMGHNFDYDEDDDAPLAAVHFVADDYAPPTEEQLREALERLS